MALAISMMASWLGYLTVPFLELMNNREQTIQRVIRDEYNVVFNVE